MAITNNELGFGSESVISSPAVEQNNQSVNGTKNSDNRSQNNDSRQVDGTLKINVLAANSKVKVNTNSGATPNKLPSN